MKMAARRRSSSSSVRRYAPRIRVFSSVAVVAPTAAPVRAKSCIPFAIVGSDAQVPLPGGARDGPARAAARIPVRLPCRPPVQAQVLAHGFAADLRQKLRGLPPVPIREAPRGSDDIPLYGLIPMCPVCSAPAFTLDGACVFCHAPLAEHGGEAELLEYLSERVPTAHVKRGAWNRGPITEAAFDVNGRTFLARWKNDRSRRMQPL